MKVSRPWLAVVFALFALPLFVGLGRLDLRGDEAAHSFSVDRILEIGDWLAPRSSPSDDAVFLEKPPLKFWIVAAPIKLGLLPHDEFGLRFWDALFGGLAFLYVFAIGSRLGGSVSGAVAVLILFVQHSLLFAHGLRGNNMEAALLLCYCGGIYHYMAAMSAPDRVNASVNANVGDARRPWRHVAHAAAVGLYFALGFMVKDVAALFMPLVLFVTSLVFPEWRRKLLRDWRAWAGACALSLALIAPWFAYATVRFGALGLAGDVRRARLHAADEFSRPAHLQPWPYYFTSMFYELTVSQSAWLVGVGLVVLLAETIRRRWVEGGAVLIWLALPLMTISAGTSKIYHYAYPYLPPAALAGGYVVGLGYSLAPGLLAGGMRLARGYLGFWLPRLKAACDRPVVRTALLALAVVAVGIAAASLVYGPVRFTLGGRELFKSSRVIRPCVIVIVVAILTGGIPSHEPRGGGARRGEPAAADGVSRCAGGNEHRRSPDENGAGLHAAGRRAARRRGAGSARHLGGRLRPRERLRPRALLLFPVGAAVDGRGKALVGEAGSVSLRSRGAAPHARARLGVSGVHARIQPGAGDPGAALPPMLTFGDVVLILPGPYAVCSSEAANKRADIR